MNGFESCTASVIRSGRQMRFLIVSSEGWFRKPATPIFSLEQVARATAGESRLLCRAHS